MILLLNSNAASNCILNHLKMFDLQKLFDTNIEHEEFSTVSLKSNNMADREIIFNQTFGLFHTILFVRI